MSTAPESTLPWYRQIEWPTLIPYFMLHMGCLAVPGECRLGGSAHANVSDQGQSRPVLGEEHHANGHHGDFNRFGKVNRG